MEPEDIPHPEDLWWSAVVLAALDRAGGSPSTPRSTRLDRSSMAVALDLAEGAWLRVQRCRGGRFVLWGRSPLAPAAPSDARREAPDWALSRATDAGRPTFVAWWAHDEWDASTPQDHGVPQLLRPLLTVDPRLATLARGGRLGTDDLAAALPAAADPEGVRAAQELVREAAAPPPALARGSLASRLRVQVHGQMREAAEADRMLLQQPPELVRWASVHGPRSAFEHAVMLRRQDLVPAPTNTALPSSARRTLDNVLRDLHRQEASEQHGAWLFVRVHSDGVVVGFDRAFDHWPAWWRVAHPALGPTLDDLAWEMAQRSPDWRPAWTSLLPEQTTSTP